jgi:hypothetical protein
LVFFGKDFVLKRCQIHEGYAARFNPCLTQKSTAQPLAFLLPGYGLDQQKVSRLDPKTEPAPPAHTDGYVKERPAVIKTAGVTPAAKTGRHT